jgi:HSP20 family protein
MHTQNAIYQNEESYLIVLDLPGVSNENLEVSIDANLLTIEGKRNIPEGTRIIGEVEKETIRKRYSLHAEIDSDAINASLSKGVLTLNLPKKKSSKKISISTS